MSLGQWPAQSPEQDTAGALDYLLSTYLVPNTLLYAECRLVNKVDTVPGAYDSHHLVTITWKSEEHGGKVRWKERSRKTGTHTQCFFRVAPHAGDTHPAQTSLEVQGHTLKFLNQTIGEGEWSYFLAPTVYTATTHLFRKNPRRSRLSTQQMLESLRLSPPAFPPRARSRFECLRLLRPRLCPGAAAPLPAPSEEQ